MSEHSRPRLAVLAGPESSLSPVEIARSSDGLVDCWFLLDSRENDAAAQALRHVANALAPTTVVDFEDFAACRDAVRDSDAYAVTTFTDRFCGLAAQLNAEIRGTAVPLAPWGRKDVQRRALRDAGVSKVESAAVRDGRSLRSFVRSVGLPVVIKPIDGAASRDTWLLATEPDVRKFLRQLDDRNTQAGMLAEQFIAGEPSAWPHLADYVSAEVFRFVPAGTRGDGALSNAFVTDRLIPAWPCRETGLVLPSALPADRQESVIAVAETALDALGAVAGVFHVEIKPAQGAPEVIEVNGRLGGFIARLVRYGTGQDLGRVAISYAVDRYEDLDLRWDKCVLVLLFQPPARAEHIAAAPSRRAVAGRPGVLAVDEISPAGTTVDWRDGSNKAAAWVWLGADSHAELRACLADLVGFLSEKFSFVTSAGRPVYDSAWIGQICAS